MAKSNPSRAATPAQQYTPMIGHPSIKLNLEKPLPSLPKNHLEQEQGMQQVAGIHAASAAPDCSTSFFDPHSPGESDKLMPNSVQNPQHQHLEPDLRHQESIFIHLDAPQLRPKASIATMDSAYFYDVYAPSNNGPHKSDKAECDEPIMTSNMLSAPEGLWPDFTYSPPSLHTSPVLGAHKPSPRLPAPTPSALDLLAGLEKSVPPATTLKVVSLAEAYRAHNAPDAIHFLPEELRAQKGSSKTQGKQRATKKTRAKQNLSKDSTQRPASFTEKIVKGLVTNPSNKTLLTMPFSFTKSSPQPALVQDTPQSHSAKSSLSDPVTPLAALPPNPAPDNTSAQTDPQTLRQQMIASLRNHTFTRREKAQQQKTIAFIPAPAASPQQPSSQTPQPQHSTSSPIQTSWLHTTPSPPPPLHLHPAFRQKPHITAPCSPPVRSAIPSPLFSQQTPGLAQTPCSSSQTPGSSHTPGSDFEGKACDSALEGVLQCYDYAHAHAYEFDIHGDGHGDEDGEGEYSSTATNTPSSSSAYSQSQTLLPLEVEILEYLPATTYTPAPKRNNTAGGGDGLRIREGFLPSTATNVHETAETETETTAHNQLPAEQKTTYPAAAGLGVCMCARRCPCCGQSIHHV